MPEHSRQSRACPIRPQHRQILVELRKAVRGARASAFRRVVNRRGCAGSSAKDQVALAHAVALVGAAAARIHPHLMHLRRDAFESFLNVEAHEGGWREASRAVVVSERHPAKENGVGREIDTRWLWAATVAR